MVCELENIVFRSGDLGQRFQFCAGQRSVGKNAWRSRDRVLWKEIYRHHRSISSERRCSTSKTGDRGQDRQLHDAQNLSFLGRIAQKCKLACGPRSSGHNETIYAFPIPDNVARRFLEHKRELEETIFVRPANLSQCFEFPFQVLGLDCNSNSGNDRTPK